MSNILNGLVGLPQNTALMQKVPEPEVVQITDLSPAGIVSFALIIVIISSVVLLIISLALKSSKKHACFPAWWVWAIVLVVSAVFCWCLNSGIL
jgi:hypothetical protein